ncbi:MAG: hypothetical protein ACM3S2_05155 [Ignavibacteriales bacterium]
MNSINRESIDQLIKHFWQNGYLTVSRKYGTYLPAPNPVGTYNVDAIGRYNKKYAIGVVLTSDDIEDNRSIERLNYLATRQTRFSNIKVTLFVGVEPINAEKARLLIDSLSEEARRNIKLVLLNNNSSEILKASNQSFGKGFSSNF